jgi:hypothetical protein
LMSLYFYEAVIPPFFLICLAVSVAEARKRAMAYAAPLLAPFGVWAVSYFVYRHMHPSGYGGSQLSSFTGAAISEALRSLSYYVTLSLPAANWIAPAGAQRISLLAAPCVIAFALACGAVVAWALSSRPLFRAPSPLRREYIVVAALAGFAVLSLQAILILTPRYRNPQFARGAAPYITGYYAYLAWTVLLVVIVHIVLHLLRQRRTVSALMTGLAACGAGSAAMLTASANTDIAYDQRTVSGKWRAIDVLSGTRFAATLPPGTVLLAPKLWDGLPDPNWSLADNYWTAYLSSRLGRTVRVLRSHDQAMQLQAQGVPVYYCEHVWLHDRADSALLLSAVTGASPHTTDRLIVVVEHPLGDIAVEYASATSPSTVRKRVGPAVRDGAGFVSESAGEQAVLASVKLLEGPVPEPSFHVKFEKGFSAPERKDDKVWIWSDGEDGEGELGLVNPLSKPATVRFRAILDCDGPGKRARFDFSGLGARESIDAVAGQVFERRWTLQPGNNPVRIKCYGRRIGATNDPRFLVFALKEWSVTPES